MVYVISKEGKPLMPTKRHGKVRRMIRTGEAIVVRRTPFTIRLLRESELYTQPVTLGVDAGSKVIGLSASTEKKELYAAEVHLRTDVTELLSTRRAFRRARRNRTTRYRAPRFKNRRIPKGWLAPTIENKIHRHIKCVEDVHKILPITDVVIEVASFDNQKIKNPDISGKEYQEGDKLGFWNVREYVLWRDNHECQYCHGKSKDKVLNVHHLESRKTGGDAPNNLATLCETCHDKYHKGEIELKIKRGVSYRDSAFMGIMRWTTYNRLKEMYPNVHMTYGYITKNTRITNGLEKSHITDALCIANHPKAEPIDTWYYQKAVRRHNRSLHKATILKGGYRKANQAPKYVFGFQLFDKVRTPGGREGFVFARRSSGYFDVRTLDGEKLSSGISYKKLKRLECRKTLLTERRRGSSPYLKAGVSAAK
jgi:hypothetical protein